jgi:hypothetical protein
MHHVRGRWQQLDTPWNLICLCLACHMKNHNGQAPRPAQVLKKVAERMSKQLGVKVTPAAIQSVANLFRLMSVKDSDETNLGKIRKLSGAARQLGMASWLRYLALRERR